MKDLNELYNESPTKTKTRMKIIEVSSSLFSDVGIDVVTMTDIAQQCDITIRNLYRYYTSKEFLVVDVAYDFFCKVKKVKGQKEVHYTNGIDFLDKTLKLIYEADQSETTGLSLTKFIMYFDLYLYKMPKDHPAYIKYTQDYVQHIQEWGNHDIEEAIKQGIKDGSIDLQGVDITITVEYIMQSLFSIIMRTLIKESENKMINRDLVHQHIKVLVDYYRRRIG